MAATLSFFLLCSAIALLLVAVGIGKAPFPDRDLVIGAGEHPAAAGPDARSGQRALALEPLDQLPEQPGRHLISLARVDPTEIEDVHQQHLPMQIHVSEQPPPIDMLMLLENDMHDIGAVVARAGLNKR